MYEETSLSFRQTPYAFAWTDDQLFFMHDDGHTVLPADFAVMTDFMDRHFTNQVTHTSQESL